MVLFPSWLSAQSTCLSTLRAQSRRHPAWEWNSPRQWFLTSMTDTLEMCIVHRASHHCSPTGRQLQAAGVSFAWFLQKLMALKTLSNVSCFHTAEKESDQGSGRILQKGCKETMRQLQLERKTDSLDQRAHPRCRCSRRVYSYWLRTIFIVILLILQY